MLLLTISHWNQRNSLLPSYDLNNDINKCAIWLRRCSFNCEDFVQRNGVLNKQDKLHYYTDNLFYIVAYHSASCITDLRNKIYHRHGKNGNLYLWWLWWQCSTQASHLSRLIISVVLRSTAPIEMILCKGCLTHSKQCILYSNCSRLV